MSTSSTTTARWYRGVPFDRTMTKSSMVSFSTSIPPRIRSSNTVFPSGILSRMTGLRPSASSASASAVVMSAYRRSFRQDRPSARASFLFASSSSGR